MNRFPDSVEELMANPTAFGMPTFEEFRRNKEKYVGRPDDEIAAIDRGDQNLKCRQKYFIEGYPVSSLEKAERIALDMGKSLFHDFKTDPQVRTDDRGGFYIEVNFRAKQRR